MKEGLSFPLTFSAHVRLQFETLFGFTAPCSWGMAKAADYDGRLEIWPNITPDTGHRLQLENTETLSLPRKSHSLPVHPLDQVAGSRSHIKIFKAGTNIYHTLPMSGAAWLTQSGHTRLSGSRLGRVSSLSGPIRAELPPPAANQRPGLWAENRRELLCYNIYPHYNGPGTQNYKRETTDRSQNRIS